MKKQGRKNGNMITARPISMLKLFPYRLNLLRKYRTQQRVLDALYLLQEGLTHDIANIGHPMLFTATYLGTKQLIVDYVEEVSHCLRFIAISTCQTLTLKQKINFLKTVKKPMVSLL
jgi:NTE family protein